MNSTTRGMLDYQSLYRKRARARLLSWRNKIEPERLANLVWRKGMGKTRLQTRLKINGIVPNFCAL